MIKTLNLRVSEAVQDDVNKGIVRIDSTLMRDYNLKSGDIVEIKGQRSTYAIVDRGYPGDIGLFIIRMDGIIRKNARTSIGETVQVIPIASETIKEAKKITISPSNSNFELRADPRLFKQGLLGKVVTMGDLVTIGGSKKRKRTMQSSPFDDIFNILEDNFAAYGLGELKFIVSSISPSKIPCIISDQTEITISNKPVQVVDEPIIDVTYEDIGGLSDEVKKVREMIELPLKHPEVFERLGIEPPKGVLLHGPPGTGKTLLAKAVANESNSNFTVINGPSIMSKFYGQSEENLRKIFEDAEKNAPSIIFIDEIDAIATKREEAHGDVEKRVVAQLLALMDGLKSRGRVVVIAASNIPNSLDPALRRPGRFDREIVIGVPNISARLNILKIHTRNMPLDKDVDLEQIAAITHGFVGADLSALSKESAMVVLRRIIPDMKLDENEQIPVEVLDKIKVTQNDFLEAMKVVRPSAMREVLIEKPNVHYEDIGGLTDVKDELKEAVELPLNNPEVFKRLGIKPPKGVLLYGAPGTGKTLLAKAIATESKANFILVKGPELLSKWVGESEKAVRKIFEKARQASPSIIFFDEMDALAPRRGVSSDSQATERVVNQLLTEIDGLEELNNVVIIGATNRPDILDTALLRPGRFDRIVLAPIPDEQSRLKIFEVHTEKMPLSKDVDIKKLAKQTKGYVGADIENLCREAAIFALRESLTIKEIKNKHFEAALKKVRPSVDEDIDSTYKELKDKFSSAKANQMKKEMPSYFG